MDSFPCQRRDDLLAKPAKTDPILRNLRVGLNQPCDVSTVRVEIESKQQIWGRQYEEAEGVRLNDLATMHDLPQLDRGRGHPDAHDGFAGLGRRQEMGNRTDAANARGYRRHLIERPSFGKFLKSTQLGHMKRGIGDAAFIIEPDGDLCVSLDAGHRIDDYGLHVSLLSRNASCS